MERKPPSGGRLSAYKLRALWRDQLFNDFGLSASAFRLGYHLASYITFTDTVQTYRRTGRVVIWPSREELMEKTGIARDTIRLSITQMESRGHLRVTKRGNQFSGSNTYRLFFNKVGGSQCRA